MIAVESRPRPWSAAAGAIAVRRLAAGFPVDGLILHAPAHLGNSIYCVIYLTFLNTLYFNKSYLGLTAPLHMV